MNKNIRVTFESPNVTCIIEISGTEKTLVLTDSAGGKHTVVGERATSIANKVMELVLACAWESTLGY